MGRLIANGRPTVGIVLGDYINGFVEENWEALSAAAVTMDVNLIALPDVVQVQDGSLPDFLRMRPFLEQQTVDGLVVLGGDFMLQDSDPFLEQFTRFIRDEMGVPVAVTGRVVAGVPCAVTDQRVGMREGMAHLLDHHGYRRIAFLAGPPSHPHAAERLATYRTELEARGIAFDPSLVHEGDYSIESGMAVAEKLVQEGVGRFDALFCCNDDMLLGVLRVLEREGLHVPDDVRLVGYDDICEGQSGLDHVTSVRQPVREIAERSLRCVLARGMDVGAACGTVVYPSRLVVRSSCGCRPYGFYPSPPPVPSDEAMAWVFARLDADAHLGREQKDLFRQRIGQLPDMVCEGTLSAGFLEPVESVLAHLVWGNDLQSAWMDWFGQVRCRMPAGADAQAMERIDTLLANLRMRVDRIRRRERNIARYRTNLGQSQRMQSLVRLTQNTTLAGLTNELRRELPRLGVERYFAALYDGYDRPPMPEKLETPESGAVQPDSGATVLHALGFGPEADSAVGTRFSDACVVPPDITLRGGRFSLIAELIAFGTEVYGYQITSLGGLGEQLYDTIRPQMATALHVIRTIGRREAAVQALQRTQRQLVLSEKMAALGNLVAGFAHELNTPIGIGVTVSSHLEELLENGAAQLRKGTLTTDEAARLFLRASESARLALSTMQRASTLVSGFRRLVIEQETGVKGPFQLQESVNRVLMVLRPRLEAARVTVQVTCDSDISMDGYPGAFSLVLSNLLLNAVMHGRPDGGALCVRITVTRSGEWTEMRFEDDGVGIPEDLRETVFEPFYTTARARGATGIGLHIVFNAVVQLMQGEINCLASELGGALFVVRMRTVV